jgi:hypothetical protein
LFVLLPPQGKEGLDSICTSGKNVTVDNQMTEVSSCTLNHGEASNSISNVSSTQQKVVDQKELHRKRREKETALWKRQLQKLPKNTML